MANRKYPTRPHGFERELGVAVDAVREAAQLCQAVQRELSKGVLEKKDRSPVTIADFGSQALVCRRLREAFPNDPIIAEEEAGLLREAGNAALFAGIVGHVRHIRPEADEEAVLSWVDQGRATAYSGRFWTLDPIDGTKGFLRSDQYAVALALVVEGEVAVAALACPNLSFVAGARGFVFAAVRGAGAVRLSLGADGEAQPIRVSETAEPRQARFCESFESGHSAHGEAAAVAEQLGMTAPPVRMDSQAKYAVVAAGGADIYMRLPTRRGYVERIWDHAAGALVITEAGGRVTDVDGRPLEFRHGAGLEANRGVIATNGLLHDPVLAAIRNMGAGAGQAT